VPDHTKTTKKKYKKRKKKKSLRGANKIKENTIEGIELSSPQVRNAARSVHNPVWSCGIIYWDDSMRYHFVPFHHSWVCGS
jgi:hypothetical protein